MALAIAHALLTRTLEADRAQRLLQAVDIALEAEVAAKGGPSRADRTAKTAIAQGVVALVDARFREIRDELIRANILDRPEGWEDIGSADQGEPNCSVAEHNRRTRAFLAMVDTQLHTMIGG